MSVTIANPTSNLSGKTIVLVDGTHTLTGAWTFDRDPSAPFAVTSGSAKVDNLDADKLDGIDATGFLQNPVTADILFTDATYDVGKSGATRPRDLFLSRNAVVGGTLGVTGASTLAAVGAGAITATTITPSGLVDISGAAAGQVKFPAAQNASSNVNTLDDYEEGTWTVTDGSGAGLSIVNTGTASYIKIGQLVYIEGYITYPSTADGSAAKLGGLPFTAGTGYAQILASWTTLGAGLGMMVTASAQTIEFINFGNTTTKTNAQMTTVAIRFSGTYKAAA